MSEAVNLQDEEQGLAIAEEAMAAEETSNVEDLGQYILKALSDKKGAGIGFTLGICVAFIGLIFDNLIRTWVDKRKKHLGID